MRRGLSVLVGIVVFTVSVVPAVAEEPLPPFDGTMSFPNIQGPVGPEEFSWAVKLGEEQELRAIDDTQAGVYYTGPDEHLVFTITAGLAHAADGVNVPTTLAVTQPNVITLTVHHRAGNAAAGGAPFDYPVIAGSGWEGGFQQHTVVGPPPTEQATAPIAPDVCNVPYLSGLTLKAARRQLRRSHCTLGAVRGERSRRARVVKQFRRPGRELAAGTEVGVKLLVP
ncbi:MAG TPA: hypothetical protein VFZ29_00205 [Solirubrobacterales bacterium]